MKALLHPWRSAGSPEEGAAIVEFALGSIILLAVLFGIFEFSLVMYAYGFVSDSAREATRYAIVRGSSQGTACTAPGLANCIAQPADVQDYIRHRGYPGLSPDRFTVTTTWPATRGRCTPSVDPCNNPGNIVNINVRYDFPLTIPFVPQGTLSLRSTSEMVISY